MKSRKDKWTEEENQMLRSIVLEHIQMGATKTAAFKRAASVLGRTSAACGYRWNHVLNETEVPSTASTQLQLPPPKEYVQTSTPELDLDKVILFLQQLKENRSTDEDTNEKEALLKERSHLLEKKTSLEKIYLEKKENYQKLLQQYETFAKVLNESQELIGERSVH
ncbi:hypothetical protein EKG37_05795 [Robertmurraya yapensis]|uniref:Uncharacterized protein n=1 Tax=Bacillus yapensis TaxID=2492960 RepID=A0A3S0LH71_9BACI|nr:hypothetical protein [Bacillus yapensis]RTR35392.1 hypothetical protein EKG37_05795 [Bacillus yapensis]TKS97901.1 hypothetical protein FAR12_05795 [Bacillus yapensis]